MKPVTLTRKELYKQIWTDPVRVVGARYGVSDVGLAKLCRRNDIPVPGRGHWAKIEAGHKVRTPALPMRGHEVGEELVLRPPRSPGHPPAVETDELVLREADPRFAIRVPTRLANPLPEVAKTATILRRSSTDGRGVLGAPSEKIFDIRVTKATLSRAVRIMNTLVRACEQRGFNVGLSGDSPSRTTITALGEDFEVVLEERIRYLEPAKPRDSIFESRYDYEATGMLRLRITNLWLTGARRQWTDGKTKQVEGKLNEFMIGLVRVARGLQEERERREAERLKWEAELQRRREEERRHELERLRGAELERQAERWATAQRLREYLNAIEGSQAIALRQDLGISTMGEWLAWGQAYADTIDPVKDAGVEVSLDSIPD